MLHRLDEHQRVSSACFSPDGAYIVSAVEGMLQVWDVSNGKKLHQFDEHQDETTVFFSPDGRHIISRSTSTMRIWEASTGNQALQLDRCGDRMYLSPNDILCIVTGHDDSMRLWDAPNGRWMFQLHRDHQFTSIGFSADGTMVVAGSPDGVVRVWDVSTRKQLRLLEGHSHPVSFVGFSPDGKRIISASYDHTMRVWEGHQYQWPASVTHQKDTTRR